MLCAAGVSALWQFAQSLLSLSLTRSRQIRQTTGIPSWDFAFLTRSLCLSLLKITSSPLLSAPFFQTMEKSLQSPQCVLCLSVTLITLILILLLDKSSKTLMYLHAMLGSVTLNQSPYWLKCSH